MFNKAKKVLTKLLTFSFAACCAIGLTVGLTGCDEEQQPAVNPGNNTTPVVSVKDVKQDGNVITITYTDGKTETITIDIPKDACDHKNDPKIVHVQGHKTLKDSEGEVYYEGQPCVTLEICPDCGAVTVDEENPNHLILEEVYEGNCEEGTTKTIGCRYCDYMEEEIVVVAPKEHTPATKYTVPDGWDEDVKGKFTICEHGSIAITYCTECEDVLSTEMVDPMGHHSTEWKKAVDPENGKPGYLEGKCDTCNVEVVGGYNGCGENVPYDLPALDAKDKDGNSYYVLSDVTQTSCTAEGTATYTIVVDGQTFEFKDKVLKKDYHMITLADGTTAQFEPGDSIWDDDAKYVGMYELIDGEVVSCANDGAQATFRCAECQKLVSIIVKQHHELPDAKDVIVHGGDKSNKDAISYKCAREDCGANIDHEVIDHVLTYDIEVEGEGENAKVYLVTTCANEDKSGKGNNCGYYSREAIKEYTVEVTKQATCTAKGEKTYTYIDKNGKEQTATQEILMLKHNVDDTNYYFANAEVDAALAKEIGIEILDEGVEFVTCKTGAVTGVFVCKDCGRSIGVKLIAPHTYDEKAETTIYPTCTKAGQYYCTVCKTTIYGGTAEGQDKAFAATGCKLEYTYVSFDSETEIYTFSVVCKNKGCDATVETPVTALKANCVVDTTDPTCLNKGKEIITVYNKAAYDKDGTLVVIPADKLYVVEHELDKVNHTHETVGVLQSGVVYDYDEETMTWIDMGDGEEIPDCSSKSGAKATFTCTVCMKGNCGISVKLKHTRPEDETAVTEHKATCTEDAYYTFTCDKCNEAAKEVAYGTATGHSWKYDDTTLVKPSYINQAATGSLEVICTNENCTLPEISIVLPALNTKDYYVVEEVPAACGQDEVVKYTISAEKMAELINAELKKIPDNKVTVTAKECGRFTFEHKISDALAHEEGAIVYWNEVVIEKISGIEYYVTYECEAQYCSRCDRFVLIDTTQVGDPVPVVPAN